MEYALLFGFVAYIFFASDEIKKLKKQVKKNQQQLNELCKRTENNELCSYFISNEIKEKALHLKNSGKLSEAITEIQSETNMDFSEAKKYVNNL